MNPSEPLLSNAWYRVADLRARMDTRVACARQLVRGQVWQVLTEPNSGRQVRLNAPAYAFAGRCDGTASVEQIWQHLQMSMGDAAPTQEDILQLLARLQRAAVLQFDSAPNLAARFDRRSGEKRRRRRAWIRLNFCGAADA